MSEREAFLARWARLKREAAESRANPVPEESKQPPAEESLSEAQAAPSGQELRAELEKNLPPIETIDSATDVRAFLKEGVPADLTRAALRRAWSADPAIRDFVGLSENAWDFNAPDGVPGFGSFSPDLARQAVSHLLDADRPDPERAEAAREPEHEVVKPSEQEKTEGAGAAGVPASTAQPSGERVATQQEPQTDRPFPGSRSKGRASAK